MKLRTSVLTAWVIAVAGCGGAAIGSAPTRQRVMVAPAEVQRVLDDIKTKDAGQLAVSEADGEFLRVSIATRGTRRALEIGGASGYSGIWMGLGLRETGGTLVSIEFDPVRAAEAAANIARAGLDDVVTVIHGDAFAEIPKLAGTFDFVFLDAWKADYKRFFDLTFPRLDEGGVLMAHNVINKGEDMPDFLHEIHRRADGWTSIVAPSGEGISITYKRRHGAAAPGATR